jgi:two-component system sensor kinase FixL
MAVALIAVAALLGWGAGSVTLTSVLAGSMALQPVTAIALLVGAVGLLAGATGHRRMAQLAGAVLLAACAVWLAADAFPHPLPTDLLLFRAPVLAQTPTPRWPGRPSVITCIVIGLFAASLLGVGQHRPGLRLAAVTAASLGGLLAFISILPFLVQDPSQLSILHQSLRIALNTSIAVGGLCAGVLILKRNTGWVRVVSGGGERARIARFLTPVALIPVGFGTVANIGVRAGVYGPDVRMLLIIMLSAVALLFLAYWAAHTLGRERAQSDGLAQALERSTVMVVDGEGRILHWPRACEDLYGWTAAEALGRRPVEFLKVGPATRDEIGAALRERGEWRGEALHTTKDGGHRWVAVQWVRQERTPDGETRTVGTISDITELKAAEALLQDSRERLRLAVEAYDLAIADLDVATGTVICDDSFERLLGLEPGGLNSDLKTLNAMVVSANPNRDLDIAAGAPQQFDDVQMRRADGEVRDFHGVRRFFYSPEGKHRRTIGIYRDVTEEKRAERELAQRGDYLAALRSDLAHVSRLSAVGEMAAGLAHELNQPLTAIGNYVGALKLLLGSRAKPLDDIAYARVVRAADQAEGQAVRAGEIVRRLRDFVARGEADARVEELGPLIVDSVALGVQGALSAAIDIRLNLSPLASRVLADRIQIQQILVNLIRNAAEAMVERPAPHILTLSTTVRDGMAEIAVSDNGPGISADLAAQLFSPFTSTKTTGMGVGLSICRRIVEAHGGEMWLADTSGGGADFRFTLPLVEKELRHAV